MDDKQFVAAPGPYPWWLIRGWLTCWLPITCATRPPTPAFPPQSYFVDKPFIGDRFTEEDAAIEWLLTDTSKATQSTSSNGLTD